MTTVNDLNCRLLCACNVTYEIAADGRFSPGQPYYDAVGFLKDTPPSIITGGRDGIDACYVGTCSDCVILAFRGTLPPAADVSSLLDWWQDFHARTISVDNLPGKVHEGFYASVQNIWERLLAEVKKQTAGGKPLYITGHSKGAPMATLASLMLNNIEGIKAKDVVTVASPNAGDGAFKKGYDALFSQTHYTYHLDMVPFLPPTKSVAEKFENIPLIGRIFEDYDKYDYQTVGSGIFINGEGQTISEAENPNAYKREIAGDLDDILGHLLLGGFPKVALAHSPTCGFGYMRGICQSTVCGS